MYSPKLVVVRPAMFVGVPRHSLRFPSARCGMYGTSDLAGTLAGLTHVIDTGLSAAEAEGLVASAGEYVDLVRLGWGSAYVTRDVEAKISTYRQAGVPVMLGGTLTELAWLQGRVDALRDWLKELAIEHVEVSSGTVRIPDDEKLELIGALAADFTVFAEVGE